MRMISILCSPKPFTGRALANQTTAILSWKRACPQAEIICYGRGEGIETACHDLGMIHVPEISRNAQGTPLFGGIVEHATANARHELLLFINSDIVLLPDFHERIADIRFTRYLAVGQRLDLAESANWDIEAVDWQEQLKRLLTKRQATPHSPTGSDYFLFRKRFWRDLPSLAIGRAGYDNALMAICLQMQEPLVDTSLVLTALHLYHDYGHVQGGKDYVFGGVEAAANLLALKGGPAPCLRDATWRLDGSGLRKGSGRGAVFHRLSTQCFHAWGKPSLSRLIGVLAVISGRLFVFREKDLTAEAYLTARSL